MRFWTEIAYILVAIGKPVYWLIFKLPKKTKITKKSPVKITYSTPKRSLLKALLKNVYLFKITFPTLQIPLIKLPKIKPNIKFAFAGFGILILVFGIYMYVFRGLPSPTTLTTKPVPLTTHIRDRNGITLYKLYKNQNRTLVRLDQVPIYLRQATIAIEDKSFYRHSGFSIAGTFRAVWRNVNGKSVEGGSTITQQLVKTALLSPERTLQRKVRELVLAIAVELLYSKDQILEMYLNRVSFGGEAYGVEEAAQTYFGKPVSELSLSQSALLAGLPASPTTYSPFGSRPELAKSRQKEVLRRMSEDGHITWELAQKTSEAAMVIAAPRIDIKAPHFVMYVKELLAQKYGSDVVEQGGLDVTTSLDLALQEKTQEIVYNETARVAYLRIGNGAALVTNPTTGEILAMVGSRDYFDTKNDGNVNVTRALRQPGSSIKPINYALALMHNFTPGTLIEDSPITYRTPGQPNYSPVNYDGKWHGKVPLRIALGSSYNIPAVKVLAANGVENMISLAQEMGITTWNDPSRFGLSLTLGGGEVTMLDMATIYGVLANVGQRVNLHPILAIRDSNGKVLEKLSSFPATQVLDPKIAYLITDILADNNARAPAFGYRSDLFIPGQQIAVKTGTTNNLRDNWTIGYSPDRLVAVWVGNNDNSSMSYVASGITGASPIWRKIMDELLKGKSPAVFTPPADLIKLAICTITGELACEGCPSRTEFFVPGTQPTRTCSPEAIKKIFEDKAKKDQEERDKILNGAKIGM